MLFMLFIQYMCRSDDHESEQMPESFGEFMFLQVSKQNP